MQFLIEKTCDTRNRWSDIIYIYISIRAMTCFRIELEARCTEKATIQNRMNDEKKEQQSSCSSWTITLFFNLINCIRDMSERFSTECTMYTSGRAHTHTQTTKADESHSMHCNESNCTNEKKNNEVAITVHELYACDSKFDFS